MGKYYSSDWLQARSMGIFVSTGLHILVLGIIIPRLSGEELLLKGQLKFRNIELISLDTQQQERLPEALQPPNPTVNTTSETLEDSTPVFNNEISLTDDPNLETIPLPPPVDLPPPPSLQGLPPVQDELTPNLISLAPPPIPRELIEIINPLEDSFNSPKISQPEIVTEPEIATQPTITPKEREKNLISSVREQAELLKYNPNNTSAKEIEDNYQRWLSWQTQDNSQKLYLQGKYPKDACIKRIEGTTVYGVLVNSQGEIVNLYLIQSSGYPLLNQEATKAIESYQFNPSTETKSYLTTVEFRYNADLCPSLSISPP